jgi:hypothetical protein
VRTRDAEGKSRVRQKVLAYLGQFDSIEDAYVNASRKRRAKLSMYRDPQDVREDARELAMERAYHREQRQIAPREDIRVLLPGLGL